MSHCSTLISFCKFSLPFLLKIWSPWSKLSCNVLRVLLFTLQLTFCKQFSSHNNGRRNFHKNYLLAEIIESGIFTNHNQRFNRKVEKSFVKQWTPRDNDFEDSLFNSSRDINFKQFTNLNALLLCSLRCEYLDSSFCYNSCLETGCVQTPSNNKGHVFLKLMPLFRHMLDFWEMNL